MSFVTNVQCARTKCNNSAREEEQEEEKKRTYFAPWVSHCCMWGLG